MEKHEKPTKFVEQEVDDKSETLFLAYYSSTVLSPNVCFMDSGSSNHMTSDLETFSNLD